MQLELGVCSPMFSLARLHRRPHLLLRPIVGHVLFSAGAAVCKDLFCLSFLVQNSLEYLLSSVDA